VIWWNGKSNVTSYGYLRNWIWWLQRISGIAILLFLLFHVGGTRILAEFRPDVAENMFGHMKALFSNPFILGFYVVGLAFSVFHFANGLWTMGITWGVFATEKVQKLWQLVFAGMFVVVTALGVHGVVGFLIAPDDYGADRAPAEVAPSTGPLSETERN
jgi:succinate dehydrogenase / fumarate reductase, cytochrome b subunit